MHFRESAYLQRELIDGNESRKEEHRRTVAKFFEAFLRGSHHRLLTFPATKWKFERRWLRENPSTVFTCVEREKAVFAMSSKNMPGSQTVKNEILPVKPQATIIETCVTPNARLWCTSCSTLMMAAQDDRWRLKYANWTAVWLDNCSNLTREVMLQLQHIGHGIQRDRVVPVAVTVEKGRDPQLAAALKRNGNDRGKLISQWANELAPHHYVILDEAVEHVSAHTPMTTAYMRFFPLK